MHVTGLLIESVPVVLIVTSVVYQPLSPSVPAVTASVAVGGVLSSLTVSGAAFVVRPALLVQEPLKTAPAVSVVWDWSPVQTTGLLIESVPVVLIVTSLVYQPLSPSVPAAARATPAGPVLSSLIVTEAELGNPAPFVAEQVTVWPVVSELSVVLSQPEDDAMPDSGSLTFQLTVTLLVYQPLAPAVPVTEGVMTGGVASAAETTNVA